MLKPKPPKESDFLEKEITALRIERSIGDLLYLSGIVEEVHRDKGFFSLFRAAEYAILDLMYLRGVKHPHSWEYGVSTKMLNERSEAEREKQQK